MGRLPEAEVQIRRSLEMRCRTGSLGYAYALSLLDLGRVVAGRQRLAEAEALNREGLVSLATFVERGDGRINEAATQLADVLRAQGKTAEADAVLREYDVR